MFFFFKKDIGVYVNDSYAYITNTIFSDNNGYSNGVSIQTIGQTNNYLNVQNCV